jgi:4-carboxymuconolactone decarboxylase
LECSVTQTRFESLTLDQMTPEQQQVARRSMSGPRQKVGAPFKTLLHSAGVADPIERLGDYVRFKSAIPQRLTELVILIIARHWTAQYPWSVHYVPALESGVSAAVVEQIAAGRRPTGMQADETVIYDFCKDMLDGKGAGDQVFAALSAAYGKSGVVDLIGLMGYYFTLSMALVADRYPPVEGKAPRLQPLTQEF